ncbi:MAG: nucleoside monophosphate kinase [Holosporales bacterium]|jgi:adenylate kinase|nr:nucleoside monophosphate kinase [Holosporales bacterium]
MWVNFLGAPGCGKGTQAKFLVDNCGFFVISVGDILRHNNGKVVTDDGRTVGEIICSGSLLPDCVIVDLVRSELNKVERIQERDVSFDGFPRTVGQAEAQEELAHEFDAKVTHVLNFEMDHEVITRRILGRYECSKCGRIYNDFFSATKIEGVCDDCGGKEFDRRLDDNEESLKKRLSEYKNKTLPLIGFFEGRGVLREIDASRPVQSVRSDIEKILRN